MKLRYMNGEKVYVDQGCGFDPNARVCLFDGNIQILKHKELVRALNSLFKDAEEKPDDVCFDLWNLIYHLNLSGKPGTHHPNVETLKEYAIKFDDPRKVRLAQKIKRAELQTDKNVKIECGIKLVKGGSCIDSNPVDNKAQDILTPLGDAWLREQRAKTEHHENV